MAIREVDGRHPIVLATKITPGIRQIPTASTDKTVIVGKKDKIRNIPAKAIAKKEVKVAKTLPDLLVDLTKAVGVLAKGIESVGEQTHNLVPKIVAENEQSNIRLAEVVKSRTIEEARPKQITFNITHRDDNGRIANFIATEGSSISSVEETKLEEVAEEQSEEQSYIGSVDSSVVRTTAKYPQEYDDE